MKMEKEMTPNEKRPQQDCGGMLAQVKASVEILSLVPVSGKCSEKDYERLFIRDPEVKAREGKMAYVRPEYHERIMRITRVIGHDRLTLSAYIDHVLTHHFNQCEDAIKSLYARNYNSVFYWRYRSAATCGSCSCSFTSASWKRGLSASSRA